MNAQSTAARKAAAAEHKQLIEEFENCAGALLDDIADGDFEPEIYDEKVWTCLFIGATAKIGVWYRTATIIDFSLLPGYDNLHLTIDGRRVCSPDAFSPFWTNDLRLLSTYSTEQLRQMIENIESLYRDYPPE